VKRQYYLFGALVAGFLLTACGAAQPEPSLTPTFAFTSTAQLTIAPTKTSAPSPTAVPRSPVCSPLADHALTDLRKYMTQPFLPPQGENKETGHHGVDFAYYHRDGVGGNIMGTPIQSVLNGYMAGLGYNSVYGNYLIIETPVEFLPPDLAALYPIENGESIYLLYAHMENLAPFEIHEPLDCGQVVGRVGGTGDPYFVSDPHLHFETRVAVSGIFIEPMAFYDTQASDGEKAEYMRWRTSDTFRLYDPMLLLDFGAQHEEVNG